MMCLHADVEHFGQAPHENDGESITLTREWTRNAICAIRGRANHSTDMPKLFGVAFDDQVSIDWQGCEVCKYSPKVVAGRPQWIRIVGCDQLICHKKPQALAHAAVIERVDHRVESVLCSDGHGLLLLGAEE
jgi:hypothetical protein